MSTEHLVPPGDKHSRGLTGRAATDTGVSRRRTASTADAARVVVIGGGYAGALAANRLCKRADVEITLVNDRPVFVERVRLHQVAAGTADGTVRYDGVLAPGVCLVVDTATRIDTAARLVRLASGRSLPYDYVIYAVGSTAAIPSTVAGAAEFAVPVADFESAGRLRARLDATPRDAPVVVVGGGLTGIETAAELAERGRHVTLVSRGPLLPDLNDSARRRVTSWLSRHGVVVACGAVAEVSADAVVLADRRMLPSAVTVWTAGFAVPRLAADSGLHTDPVGRLLTDETLTSVDDERIVAAGDAAAPSGVAIRMSCQAAGPLGAQAADTVLSRVAGIRPAPIDLALTGACISLGRRAAVKQLAHKDETPLGLYIGGRLGAAYKEFTSRLGVGKIRTEARRPGSLIWPKGGPRPQDAGAVARASAG